MESELRVAPEDFENARKAYREYLDADVDTTDCVLMLARAIAQERRRCREAAKEAIDALLNSASLKPPTTLEKVLLETAKQEVDKALR